MRCDVSRSWRIFSGASFFFCLGSCSFPPVSYPVIYSEAQDIPGFLVVFETILSPDHTLDPNCAKHFPFPAPHTPTFYNLRGVSILAPSYVSGPLANGFWWPPFVTLFFAMFRVFFFSVAVRHVRRNSTFFFSCRARASSRVNRRLRLVQVTGFFFRLIPDSRYSVSSLILPPCSIETEIPALKVSSDPPGGAVPFFSRLMFWKGFALWILPAAVFFFGLLYHLIARGDYLFPILF